MDKQVGRALDWLLCAIIAALLVPAWEMPTKLKAIWEHIRRALAGYSATLFQPDFDTADGELRLR